MANLGKEKTIEQIKAEIASLSPEERAERLKKAREMLEKKKQIVLNNKVATIVVHEDYHCNYKGNNIDLSKVRKFEKSAYFYGDDITEMPELTTICGKAEFTNANIENLPKLQTIGGHAWFHNTKLKTLPKLTTIGGQADFRETGITSLPELTTVNGDILISAWKLIDMPKLQSCEYVILIDKSGNTFKYSLENYKELVKQHKEKQHGR